MYGDFPTERIKENELEAHLIKRVHDLNIAMDIKASADKLLLARTIETNIKIYENSFGEFPGKAELRLERAYISHKSFKDSYDD